MAEDQHEGPFFEARMMAFGRINYSKLAEKNFNDARIILELFNKGELINTETQLRNSLEMLLIVFWINKGMRDRVSQQMHSIGKILREDYGCALDFGDDHYFTKCPNVLLHSDFGFSMRGFEKYRCSICDMDPIDCDHRTGLKYNCIECKKHDGRCNICCDETSSCSHHLGGIYDDVEAIKIVCELEIITFDVVKNPDYPLARVTKIPLSKDHIIENLGDGPNAANFSYGNTILNCDHCITCTGYNSNAIDRF